MKSRNCFHFLCGPMTRDHMPQLWGNIPSFYNGKMFPEEEMTSALNLVE